MPAPHREHGHEPPGRGVGRPDRAIAALARDRVGRWDDVPARSPRARAGGSRAPRRGGVGVRGRGRDSHPHARRGSHRLGRRDQGADRVPERAARGPRHPALRRTADVQLRVPARRLAGRDHARDPRRRSRLEHAEADPRAARARRRAAGVCARAERLRRGRPQALEASRRSLRGRVSRRGVSARGAHELPRPPRLGSGRRDHDHVAATSSSSASLSSVSARAPRRSTTRSSTG